LLPSLVGFSIIQARGKNPTKEIEMKVFVVVTKADWDREGDEVDSVWFNEKDAKKRARDAYCGQVVEMEVQGEMK
jgi:hypothetical protein